MHKKLIRTMMVMITSIIILSMTIGIIEAHTTSQQGIIEENYVSNLNGYYEGGDAMGWSIDEDYHTNGTYITYHYDIANDLMDENRKGFVTGGASKWTGIFTIDEDPNGTGTILAVNMWYTNDLARFVNYAANSSGHLTTWQIHMNTNKTLTASVMAHEFGHVIGLNDLFGSQSSNKLMYYQYDTNNMPNKNPTTQDKWGAKLISGVHSTHIWGYKYYQTTSTGNKHVKYCTQCGGYSLIKEFCTYNSAHICTKCGTPEGYAPY